MLTIPPRTPGSPGPKALAGRLLKNVACKAARSDERDVSQDTSQRGATKPTQQAAFFSSLLALDA